jgi:hypothetical protein
MAYITSWYPTYWMRPWGNPWAMAQRAFVHYVNPIWIKTCIFLIKEYFVKKIGNMVALTFYSSFLSSFFLFHFKFFLLFFSFLLYLFVFLFSSFAPFTNNHIS